MKTLFTTFFALSLACTYAQDEKVLIPSPEAASLIKWSKNDVNLSTGSINTMLPLYTLKDGDLEVPIGIHYNGTSGIKVTEGANLVGLGWDLVAGGKIVRIVRDKPDESYTINHPRNEKGGFDGFEIGVEGNPAGNIIGQSKVSVEWKNERYKYRGGWYLVGNPIGTEDFEKNDPVLFDSQPDIYIVNIGSDIIKFTFDKFRNPTIINNKDYKIEIDWQPYNPGVFLTKQSWSIKADIGAGDAIISQIKSVSGLDEAFLPTSLGITIGLNQAFTKSDDQYPKVLGFRGFIITASNGVKYYFGGTEEYLEYNFNDQAYLNGLDRLAIAVNNLSQRIPYAWALRKIESPFGSNKNKIDFKYKRTGFYEPFNSSDNLVDPTNTCSVPELLQDKTTKSIYGSISLTDSLFTNSLSAATAGTINISYKKPSKEDLAAFVTLNTRIIYGLYPESITSPNFKVTFNDNNLLFATLDVGKIKEIIPDFSQEQFYDLERKDYRPEGSLSSKEEENKGLVNYNLVNGQLTYTYNNLTIKSPALSVLGLKHIGKNLDSLNKVFKGDYKNLFKVLFPEVNYQGDAFSAGFNGSGPYVNWSGKIYKVDLAGEFNEVLIPNYKLKNIQVLDLNTNKSKGFYFDYDYFDGYVNPNFPVDLITKENAKALLDEVPDPGVISDLPKGMYPQLHEKYGLHYIEDKLRLKLNGVYEIILKDSVASLLPGTKFKYNSTPLPRRLSSAQDYWGFYNGQHDNRNKTQLTSRPTYSSYNSLGQYQSGNDGDPLCINSSDLRPSLVHTLAGVLNEIEFSTGAKKKFKYELHSSNDYFGKVGGLRVSEISTHEPVNGKNYFEKYKYLDSFGKSSGFLSIIPDFLFKHSIGNSPKSIILPNLIDMLSSYFINDSYISYTQVTRYDSSSIGNSNGYTQYYFSNLENNPKRKNAVLETSYELYSPRNIYQVISLPSGATPSNLNTKIDLDQIAFGLQNSYHALGEGYWNLDTLSGMLRFTPYTDFSTFPSRLNFDFYESGNPTKYSSFTTIIPYNYGQGAQIIGYDVENAYFRLGGIPRYDYSKNALQKIKTFNSQNKLVQQTEYFHTSSNDFNRITSKIEGANVLSRIPITKFSVGISIGIFFNALTVVRPEIGIAFQDRIAKSAEVYPYSINIERFDLLREKHTTWDIDGENPVTSEKEYKYSASHHNPIEISQLNSKGQKVTNLIKYSLDLSNFPSDTLDLVSFNDFTLKFDDGIENTIRSKYLNIPLEEVSIIDSMVVAAKLTELYTNEGPSNINGLPKAERILEIDAPFPFSQFNPLSYKAYFGEFYDPVTDSYPEKYVFRYTTDERYVPRIFIEEYNSKGLPTKYRKSGDPLTQVGYGFNDLIPTSKTVAFGTPLARTTTYEYIPLYGLTRITNPNLTGQKYDYDDVGRLKAVRNEQNEILKSYVYKILGF